jgi:hypothetical protein
MGNSIAEHLTITEQNRLALTRRATKLIDLLRRDECAFVNHPESTDKLIKIVDLVIYALEQSVEKADWLPT